MLLVEHNATDNFVDTKVVLFQFERGKKRTKTPTDLDNLPEQIWIDSCIVATTKLQINIGTLHCNIAESPSKEYPVWV